MMNQTAPDLSLSLTDESKEQTPAQKMGGICVAIAILALIIAISGAGEKYPALLLSIITGMFTLGAAAYAMPYFKGPAGIRNNNTMFKSMTSKGTIAWITAIVLTGFYIIIYWFAWAFEGLIRIFDPLSQLISGKPADQWFMYGAFYSLAVILMGVRFIGRYRHSRYQVIRTFSVMFFQLGFAFLIPQFLKKLNEPEFYFSSFWPLKYNYLFPSDVASLSSSGHLGVFMVFWGAMLTFISTTLLTYNMESGGIAHGYVDAAD